MKPLFNRLGVSAGLCALGAAVVIAGGAAMRAGQATTIVTVNLGAVLEKLNQRDEAERNLKAIADNNKAEIEKRQSDMSAMQKEIEKLQSDAKAQPDGKEKDQLQQKVDAKMEEAALADYRNQAWARFAADKMDIERALVAQDLYRSIKSAAASLAATAQYDLVVVDDSQGELSTSSDSRMPRESQVLQQIAGRRLLYANKAIDITDDLIQRMNNDHNAVGPKPKS